MTQSPLYLYVLLRTREVKIVLNDFETFVVRNIIDNSQKILQAATVPLSSYLSNMKVVFCCYWVYIHEYSNLFSSQFCWIKNIEFMEFLFQTLLLAVASLFHLFWRNLSWILQYSWEWSWHSVATSIMNKLPPDSSFLWNFSSWHVYSCYFY